VTSNRKQTILFVLRVVMLNISLKTREYAKMAVGNLYRIILL